MTVSAVSAVSNLASQVAGTSSADATSSTSGSSFTNLLSSGIDKLESVQDNASNLAVKAATGDLNSLHDYTVAATEASTTTSLSVSLRNRAIDSFNQIMSMQIG